ncbi:MAG: tetratricopeptide repeat protein [Deltaproteobacteria bacterium]|nr:tetratricopeptide repeat protein [Deltaproteobacteria bacterium]
MRTILATLLILLLLLPVSAIGEIQTVTHTVKQAFGGSQSPDDARISAVAKAKREALEMAGTYIESLTVVKNSQVDKDEILALAAGVLKAEVVSQKNYVIGDAFGIDVVVKIIVDTSVLEGRVKKLLQDRIHLEQLNQARVREKALLKKIAMLEGENRKSGKSKQKQAELKKEFQDASQGISALDWWDKAIALWTDGKYTDPGKAIVYLNEAIRLKPDFAEAYWSRGLYYYSQNHHQQAIRDYDESIRMKPNFAEAFTGRGFAYCLLDQPQRAIKDFDQAIRLKPDDPYIYSMRGDAYAYLGQYQQAIKDYDKAIHLKPDDAKAYYDRGLTYQKLGQYQRAIADYNEAILLKPGHVLAYGNRGNVYVNLGKHQRAIEDFNEVIRLEPNNATAYYNRGRAYYTLGQYQRAIEDSNDAIRLQPDYANVYSVRGLAYAATAQYQRAINDYNEAIRLRPDDDKAYVNRGLAYDKLGQYQRAIEDFNKAIRLKPDLVAAYHNRGIDYLQQGNKKLGCLDAQKACELGDCDLLKFANKRGDCSIKTARDGHFIAYDNGTVLDTKTNLMWAAKDNGKDIIWADAKAYCENYRGGGYMDWRMPTQDELAALFDWSKNGYKEDCCAQCGNIKTTDLIHLSCSYPWASETRGSEASYFCFATGQRPWVRQSAINGLRALPVRSGK